MSEKKCAICGRPLPPRRHIYCSAECAQEAKRRSVAGGRTERRPLTGVYHDMVCPDCGRVFSAHFKSKRCPECAARAQARSCKMSEQRFREGESRRIGSTAYCERCGRPYIVHSGAQRYCAECSPLVRKRERYAAMTDAERSEYKARVHAQYLEHRDATIARVRANYYRKRGMEIHEHSRPRGASGSPIAAARIAKGWTQQQLDAAIGARYNATATWESGRRKPGEKTLRRIAEALGVDWTTLIE